MGSMQGVGGATLVSRAHVDVELLETPGQRRRGGAPREQLVHQRAALLVERHLLGIGAIRVRVGVRVGVRVRDRGRAAVLRGWSSAGRAVGGAPLVERHLRVEVSEQHVHVAVLRKRRSARAMVSMDVDGWHVKRRTTSGEEWVKSAEYRVARARGVAWPLGWCGVQPPA